MVILPAAIGGAVGSQLPAFFNDAFEQFRQGEGGYIRDGEPEGIVAQIGQGVARAACRRYGEVLPTLEAGPQERYERACRPYLDSLEPGNGLGIDLPFRGGQCNDEFYVGTFQYETGTEANPVTQTAFFSGRGPIVGARDDGGPSSPNGTGIIGRGVGFRTGTPFGCGGIPPARNQPISYSAFVNGGRNGRITAISACGIDNCGNPEPIIRQPRPQPDPFPTPFPFNPGPNIDVDIDVDINPDGTIDVDFGTGPINVDPFPDGGDDGGGGGPGGGNPPVAGEPGDSEDTGGGGGGGVGGEAEGEAPEGKVLTGVRIDILEAPPSRSRFTLEVDRGVAYVYMGTPTEGLGLEPTGALVRTGQFFFAQKDYLTSWAVRAKPGYNLRTTPYYKDAPE